MDKCNGEKQEWQNACVDGSYSLEDIVELARQEAKGNTATKGYRDFLSHLDRCKFCTAMLGGIKVFVREFMPPEKLS